MRWSYAERLAVTIYQSDSYVKHVLFQSGAPFTKKNILGEIPTNLMLLVYTLGAVRLHGLMKVTNGFDQEK